MSEQEDTNTQPDASNAVSPEEAERLARERDEYLAGWKRAKADLINVKREAAAERLQYWNRAKEDMLRSFMPLLVALEEAHKSDQEGAGEMYALALRVLASEGINRIYPEPGDTFDPERCEALGGEGDVVDIVLQSGYEHAGQVIQPARVRVRAQDHEK